MTNVVLKGLSEMKAKLAEFQHKFPDRVAAALYQECQTEMTEAKRRTPVEYGALRASGTVQRPVRSGMNKISVDLTFGGPAAPYAIYVHENLEAHHKVGQAKFLESTLRESEPFIGARIASRLQVNTVLTATTDMSETFDE